MIKVIIVNDSNHDNLDVTLKALESQTLKDFDIMIMDPYNEVGGIKCPTEINNQINTAVITEYSDYYAVISSGCIPYIGWLEHINKYIHLNLPFLCGPVHIISKSWQPEWLYGETSKDYGVCNSIEDLNYNNFVFSMDSFKEHGGLNAVHDTRDYFKAQFNGFFMNNNYVEKIIDFGPPHKNDLYRFDTDNPPTYPQWKDVEEKYEKTKPNLIITVNVGDEFKEILNFSEVQVFKYAKKLNADVIQLTNKTQDWWGLEKFRIGNIAKNYDRVLAIDSDVWIKDDAPNIFDAVPDGHVAIYNDFIDNYDGTRESNQSILKDAQEMCFFQDVEHIPSEMYNSGVVVFNGWQSDIWEPPKKPFIQKHCNEQHWFEQNVRKCGYDVYDLNYKWNNQRWNKYYIQRKESSYFLHGVGKDNKIYFIFELYLENQGMKNEGVILSVIHKNIDFIKNKNKCVVCVCSDSNELINKTSKSHKEYANKIGADYHLITENVNPHWGMGNKYLISNFTKKYDKTLYVDSDVYIKSNSPNIFNLTPDDVISVHNEAYDISLTTYAKHIQSNHDLVCEFLGIEKRSVASLNCGVMVIPKCASHLYTCPDYKIPASWCFDQHLLWLNILEEEKGYYNLDSVFNWEYLRKDWEQGLNDAFFIHFNGIKSEEKRLRLLDEVMRNE